MLLLLFAAPSVVFAQDPSGQPPVTIRFPPVIVSAQKEPADAREVPVAVTTASAQALADAGADTVSDAAILAPNTHFTEFTARKLSNPRIRGIGASPSNAAITTYIDGVPSLHANASNLDLLQVDQIEFVRGPQSALFGRNALGGVINIQTRRPRLAEWGDWSGRVLVPFASQSGHGLRAEASGPLVRGRLGAGVSLQWAERDGYTRNTITGNSLDGRSGLSGRGQLLWTPADQWELRVLVSGERNRDGDYALSDLAGLRQAPFETTRDFEGFTNRDVVGTTVLARWQGARLAVTSTTGFLRWRTRDVTDLDYLPLDLITRDNREESRQITQEVRVGSAPNAPLRLSDGASLRWQAGVFVFGQDYEQNAANTYSTAFVQQNFSPFLDFPITETSPQSVLDDAGVGVYGQGTVTVGNRVDLVGGLRVDRERKRATLNSFFAPAVLPPNEVSEERSFSDVSPQFAVAVRVAPQQTIYGTVVRGFKAGGFNPASPPGSEAYEEEHAWNVEGGLKTLWAGGRVSTTASVFHIVWDDLQLNLPDPFAPGRFFIANAGAAASTGAEFEVAARAREGVDLFGSLGVTRARFDEGVTIGGLNVGGNAIPNTPEVTGAFGAQLSHRVRAQTTIFGRGEVSVHGPFQYDEANTQGQDAYALANFRGGVQVGVLLVEAWVRNAFDTFYVPVAFAYPGLAPSGFIGEPGRPRTFGVNLGARF